MLTGNSTASSYPFMTKSTFKMSESGLTMPPERILGAKLYPRVPEYTLLRIRELVKHKDYIKLIVVSDSDEYLFDIFFAMTDNCPHNVPNCMDKSPCVGYAIQNGELCGCLTGDELLPNLLKATPNSKFDLNAFIFSPATCFLRIEQLTTVGRLMHNNVEVRQVTFDTGTGTIIGDSGVGHTINMKVEELSSEIKTVKTVCINGEHYLGGPGIENIYIQAGKDSGVRVITEDDGITIGRLSEL